MTEKVERHCMRNPSKSISVDPGERACINCIWYEQYYHVTRGHPLLWTPTCTGRCLLHDQQRGPLRQPCKNFEEEPR